MNIQIFGTKKCKNTQKAERFFKERNIKFHLVNLAEKGIAKGELNNVARAIDLEDIIDTESQAYKKGGYEYKIFDIETELLENPLLIKSPIVRNGSKATVGLETDTWKDWLK